MSATFSPSAEDLRNLANFLLMLQRATTETGCYVGEHMRFSVTMPGGDQVQVSAKTADNDSGRAAVYQIDDRIGD